MKGKFIVYMRKMAVFKIKISFDKMNGKKQNNSVKSSV